MPLGLHDGGYTITRKNGVLVFRDPRGRVIANTGQTLTDQLDLLYGEHHHPGCDPDGRPVTDDGRDAPPLQPDAWASTPYQHGSWGWTGLDASPPSGHAPPRWPDEAPTAQR